MFQVVMPNTPLQSSVPDFAKSLKEGMDVTEKWRGLGDTHRKMAEELLSTQLQNKMNRPKAEDAQGWYNLQKQRVQALINQANRGPQLTGDAATLDYLMKHESQIKALGGQPGQPQQQSYTHIGEGNQSFIPSITPQPQSQEPQTNFGENLYQSILDKTMGKKSSTVWAPSDTGKTLDEYRDAKVGYIPHTNRTQKFTNLQDQQDALDAYSVKTTGLKKGSHYILGENGERIGEQRPMTPKERDMARGSVIFNELYPMINEGLNQYSGEGSVSKIENDAAHYKTDKAAKRRFDQFLLASALTTLTTVNEAARFGAGKQNQVFNRFNQSLSNYDVPKLASKLIKEYQIPASANIEAGNKFNRIINQADEKYKREATPNITEFYPGKAPKSKEKSDVKKYNLSTGRFE